MSKFTISNPGSITQQLKVSNPVVRVYRNASKKQALQIDNTSGFAVMISFKNGTPLSSGDHWIDLPTGLTTLAIKDPKALSVYHYSVVDKSNSKRPVNDPIIVIDPN